MSVEAMELLGIRPNRAYRMARIFRIHDEESVRELARMRHDMKAYVVRARERIQDMEQVLAEDVNRLHEGQDAAWDSESLRREYGS